MDSCLFFRFIARVELAYRSHVVVACNSSSLLGHSRYTHVPIYRPLLYPRNSRGSILCAPTVDGDSTRLDQMSQTLVIALQQ